MLRQAICYMMVFSIFCNTGANNLIPMEIALKIAGKIKQHERFSVYIVIPMWPEGVPKSTATQRILFWQVGFLYLYLLKRLYIRQTIETFIG